MLLDDVEGAWLLLNRDEYEERAFGAESGFARHPFGPVGIAGTAGAGAQTGAGGGGEGDRRTGTGDQALEGVSSTFGSNVDVEGTGAECAARDPYNSLRAAI